jgi:DtxR family Mn-dependent transcriptional regulator
MPTSTVENYLKQLYLEQVDDPAALLPMGRLASAMSVTPGTATTMVKALADSGLVRYEPRAGVQLTSAGNRLALHVLRRHRLVELFLVKVVGLDWSEVHAEAEELEHVISEKLLSRIDQMLGYPKVDPHGDPIPTPEGDVAPMGGESLINCQVGQAMEITRVADQEPVFLQFVEQCGLIPGSEVRVTDRNIQADSVTIKPAGKPALTLSTMVAAKFLVRQLQPA